MLQAISTEHLAQFLRTIGRQGQTGILHVEQIGEKRSEQGEICFESGQVISARAGRERGTAALRLMSSWEHVIYTFSRRCVVPVSSSGAQIERQTPSSKNTAPLGLRDPGPRVTRPLHPRTVESLTGTNSSNLSIGTGSDTRSSSSFVPGKRPVSYPPGHPATRDQRWDKQPGEMRALTMPSRLPDTPRPGLLSLEERLPDRLAIFKARSMATTVQALQSMGRRERIIFILLDGTRTIQDIARLTHHSEEVVEHIMVYLKNRGYADCVSG